ncbi:class I SAM-dependent methyltransferase [Actinophytocola sediminis]
MTRNGVNPFVSGDIGQVLYGTADRLAARTGALHRAKTAGRPVADVVAELAHVHRDGLAWQVVLDIGCGRGGSTQALATQLQPDLLVGVDASAAMLAAARRRMAGASDRPAVGWTRGDFHELPFKTGVCALAVAAFCLYHSPHPERAIAEIARCLEPNGLAVLVTKSLDSYHQLDALAAVAGLDRDARVRPSLYASAHSGNLASLAATALHVCQVAHERHRFRFTSLRHVAEYLATSPKYHMPSTLQGQVDAIEAALITVVPDQPVDTDSTVTYVVARRGGSQ